MSKTTQKVAVYLRSVVCIHQQIYAAVTESIQCVPALINVEADQKDAT